MTFDPAENPFADPGIYVRTLEIQWHYAAPQNQEEAERRGVHGQIEGIISIDYHPQRDRICTTGGDGCIMIWQFNMEQLGLWLRNATHADMTQCVTWVATLDAGEMPRCARWSPSGKMIASSHSDSRIRLWWHVAGSVASHTSESAAAPLEVWKDYKQLTGHSHEVMDVMFSPDSRFLISIGMQGTVMIHDLENCNSVFSCSSHPKFGYSVLWDPWNHYVTSFGCDPSIVTMSIVPPTEHRKIQLTHPQRAQASFIGESCSMSLRRMSWSPDGSLLSIPSGKIKAQQHNSSSKASTNLLDDLHNDEGFRNCVYLFQRGQLERPALCLGIRGSLDIRGTLWAPCFFEPYAKDADDLSDAKGSWGPGEYRMALAVWTEDTVMVYTTDQSVRHSDFTDLHMHSITDVAWSNDARFLFTSSLDGYVTALHYGKAGLGVVHRLPTFAVGDVPMAITKLKRTLAEASAAFEQSRTDTAKALASSVQQTHVAKKKRRVEVVSAPTFPPTSQQTEMGVDELASLLD